MPFVLLTFDFMRYIFMPYDRKTKRLSSWLGNNDPQEIFKTVFYKEKGGFYLKLFSASIEKIITSESTLENINPLMKE